MGDARRVRVAAKRATRKTRRVTVLVADDHPVMRAGLVRFVQSRKDFEVVGEVDDGDAAVDAARRLSPDVVLMDISMPTGGIEATAALREQQPKTLVVGYTGLTSRSAVAAMRRAGAAVVASKAAPPHVLLDVVEALVHEQPIPERCVSWILSERADPKPHGLTPRELTIVTHVARGESSQQIAESLGISLRTVQKHRENAMRTLGISGTSALTQWAIAHGLVTVDAS